ncbi:glycosyltransferase family 2 protein [Paenibacillus tyrfis]|uniref:glycosyltransferase family 2 protein n=1 Tax=Paenibacillus tyrfis TaxID=1501230 RepID=UPI00209FAD7D|nr:glycosyltransferase family 2 protein [Paenibacillus tyrfis]MCP1309720.1 glycosyltransferase family 2 protein [Paenibacillus tyrfis]
MIEHNKIAILLSTYNGSAFLETFFQSLLNQTYQNFTLFIRDDGSSDDTKLFIKKYSEQYDNIFVINQFKGNFGPAASFSLLLEYVLALESFNYFMFADQDDIWIPNKIQLTLEEMQKLEGQHPGKPVLVYTDLYVADKDLNVISQSYWKYQKINPRRTKLNQLLLQNVVTGCTVMVNEQLARLSVPISSMSIMHDWWLGIAANAFGVISYVNTPTVMYRQHGQNSIGAQKYGLLFILNRAFSSFSLEKHIKQATAFYQTFFEVLTEKQKEIMSAFLELANAGFLKRTYIIFKYGFFKHGIVRNIGLILLVRKDKVKAQAGDL